MVKGLPATCRRVKNVLDVSCNMGVAALWWILKFGRPLVVSFWTRWSVIGVKTTLHGDEYQLIRRLGETHLKIRD